MEKNRDITKSKTNELAAKHLGSSGSYSTETDRFDSSLLVGIPRSEARGDWDIKGTEFVGKDIWHCHEATFLLDNGFPIAGTLKFIYPAYSSLIVESKSMKLYLNSFDMCKMGSNESYATLAYEEQIRLDLSNLLGVDIQIKFHGYKSQGVTSNSLLNYNPIEDYINISVLSRFEDYTSKGTYFPITQDPATSTVRKLTTNVLRSRCRHTKQKDTGTFFGKFEGCIKVSELALLKQVVSLRMLDEFHEFCCEKLFVDIVKDVKFDCMIALLYSRRGSLDINPIRATSWKLIPKDLADVNILTTKTLGQ